LSPSGPGKSGPVSMKSLRAARRCLACVDSAAHPTPEQGNRLMALDIKIPK